MSNQPILVMENITKVYGNGFVANKDVNFSVQAGEIHALVGENGAGKSTLMKILFGEEKADFGRILLRGEVLHLQNPMSAIRQGIGMVHQHFMLAPSLTVVENIIMGMEPQKFGFIDREAAKKACQEVAEKYNFQIDINKRVEQLSVGMKQKVEILKALIRGAQILILDEPTAVLTPQETEELFAQLHKLKSDGHTIIFISHKLKEVKQLCDKITVLRRGRSVGEYPVSDLTEEDISRLMVGRDVVLKIDKAPIQLGETVLKIRNLLVRGDSGKKGLQSVSFDVRKGEILGVAGIEGNGQRELADAIGGLLEYQSGEILLNNKSIKGKTIREIRENGISHVPEDRMIFGVSQENSVMENLISDRFYKKDYNRFGLLNFKKIKTMVTELIKTYLIKCDDGEQQVRMLSGGNIQKVVVARECSQNPQMVVFNQPTRGIDVGAIEFVHKRILQLRDNGTAVLLISADLNEILELSDSLIVLCEGKIAAYFKDTKDMTEIELGEYMLGIKRMTEDEIGGVVHE